LQFDRIASEPLYNTPFVHWTYAAASDGQSSDILVKELILVLVLVRFSFINYSFYSNSVLTLFLVLVFIQFYKNNFSFSSYLVLI